MVYNAVFMTYLLLSNFEAIGEKERWVVELIVELSVSYPKLTRGSLNLETRYWIKDLDLGRIDMSRDVFGKVRMLLPQLCILAARYGYVYTDTEIGFNSAHGLLLAIVRPLVGHLCPYEHREIKATISDAHNLLDLTLPKLRLLVQQWYSNNFEVVLQTAPLPRCGQPPVPENESKVFRVKDPRAKRYGWTPTKTCEELNSERLKGSLNLSVRSVERPKLFQFRSTDVSKEELARREWPLSPVTLCSVSTDSQGPNTPSSTWDESFETMNSDEAPSSLFGQRFKKGFKAFFSSSP